jgi:membrane protein implicated in regulation of membrane protease activity
MSNLDLMQWHELLYLLPLAVGLLMSVGAALGLHGEAGGHGAHASDVHADNQSLLSHGADLVGIGRVPLTLWLGTAPLLFGATGFLVQRALAGELPAPVPIVLISFPIAAFVGTWGTGRLARLLARFLPSTETYATSQQDLVGRSGVLVLPTDTTNGLAQIRDQRNGMHQVRCRTSDGAMSKGEEILVIDYDAGSRVYIVAAIPEDVRVSTGH